MNRSRRFENVSPIFTQTQCFHDSPYFRNLKSCPDECQFEDCLCNSCDRYFPICKKCGFVLRNQNVNKSPPTYKNTKSEPQNNYFDSLKIEWIVGVVLLILIICVLLKLMTSVEKKSVNFEELKQKFPSQKNETWYHILSSLEMEVPTVKSIILLHGDEKKTLQCLIYHMVSVYNNDINLKIDDVTFKTISEARDYGEVLEHYYAVVKKHGVFLTNLDMVSANVARIFHSLCDDISSDIKPSLFIFTLKCNNNNKNLKPLEMATSVLKESWKELAENELFPLMSRIVRNVVEIVPEKNINC